MSQHKKTIEKLRRKSRDIAYDKAQSLLLYMGFEKVHQKGSHCTLRHKNGCRITLVAESDLKTHLVEQMLAILEQFEVEEDV